MSGPPTPRTPVEPALAWPPELLLRAQGVRVAIFDVDGVLTDGGLYFGPEGEALKRFHTLDGHGIKLLARAGIEPVVDGNGVVEPEGQVPGFARLHRIEPARAHQRVVAEQGDHAGRPRRPARLCQAGHQIGMPVELRHRLGAKLDRNLAAADDHLVLRPVGRHAHPTLDVVAGRELGNLRGGHHRCGRARRRLRGQAGRHGVVLRGAVRRVDGYSAGAGSG